LYASLELRSPSIVLRGRASVTLDGTTLESNCIRLDVQKERLIVDGRYVLTRNGQRRHGVRTCFDTHLKPLDIQS